MTVEGLHTWPIWKVVVKDGNNHVYGRIDVVAPTAKDALEAAQTEARQGWGYPDTLQWSIRKSPRQPVNVVHYV